jgi:FkbM family methyltransferase
MIPHFIYASIPYLAKLPIPETAKKVLGRIDYINMIYFWKKYASEFEVAGNQIILRDLKLPYQMSDTFLPVIELYFHERKNYKIYRENNRILMEIEKLKFTLPFPFGIFELVEVWRDKCYGHLNLEGKFVVDVGAFIGDTALYFVKQGARKVLAFEPAPPLFEIARENITQNNQDDKVEISNNAVGCYNGTATFLLNLSWLGSSTFINRIGRSTKSALYQINVISLRKIIEEVGPIDFLKMDCEGAEQEIIPYAYEEGLLKKIGELVMEVHGSPKNIMDILKKAKFRTESSKMNIPNRYYIKASRI